MSDPYTRCRADSLKINDLVLDAVGEEWRVAYRKDALRSVFVNLEPEIGVGGLWTRRMRPGEQVMLRTPGT